MLTSRRKAALFAAVACLAVVPLQATVSAATDNPSDAAAAQDMATYRVSGTDANQRTVINKTGAQVLSENNGVVTIEASGKQAETLKSKGFKLDNKVSLADWHAKRAAKGKAKPGDFPPGDEAYHTYDEMNAELDKTVKAHPDIAARSSMGQSFEKRDIPMLKITKDPNKDDPAKPEVLFNCNQHAREHLTTEMCLHIIDKYTNHYNDDPEVKKQVDSKVIWVVPITNPDGSIYDVASGEYQGWRKNRDGSGTDTNRNHSFKWNCCGGSSDDPNADDYHGTGPASSTEDQAFEKWVDSRKVNGQQRIKGHIDWHTYSELVMWPFGHTKDTVTDGMTQQEYDRFKNVGEAMAQTNGYKPEQSSALYTTDGDLTDYMWGQQHIFSYTIEMYPKEGSGGGLQGFYPPGSVIPEQTARNDKAVAMFLNEVK